MFVGHYAVAFAAKKVAPRTSLGTLFLSTQFVDLLWPLFLLMGLENLKIDPGNTVVTPLDFQHYPYSHSLVGVICWSLLLGFTTFTAKGYRRGAWVVGFGVFSHWLLDALVHRPDLPLFPGGQTTVGLGLWNSLAGTVIVEGGLFLAGLIIYLKVTGATGKKGQYGLWALVGTLVLIYAGSLLGPPPPNELAVTISALGSWLFVAWAYWIDRHREMKV